MPEAAIDEYRHAGGTEHKIRSDASAGGVDAAVLAIAQASRVER